MTTKWIYTICMAASFTNAVAQEIDNTNSFRSINSSSYIRLTGDDDVLNQTDDQYTEGLNLEYCSPSLKKFPLTALLIHPSLANKSVVYGINIEQEGYTPQNLIGENIATGDHPFAATLFLSTFMITTDNVKKYRLASVLSTGVIGPDALGKQLQDNVHVLLNDVVPAGWQYEIHNDVILNYEVNYQYQLVSIGRAFSMDADAMGRVGTFNDKICPGVTVMAGNFTSPFSTPDPHKKFDFYIFDHPEFDIVAYDATLEGGMFDKGSPYVIAPADISRGVFKNFSGFTVSCKHVSLQYYHCYESKQFTTGPEHSWDGVSLVTSFK